MIKINGLEFNCKPPFIESSFDHDTIIIYVDGEYKPRTKVMHIVYDDNIYHGEKLLRSYNDQSDITGFLVWVDKELI